LKKAGIVERKGSSYKGDWIVFDKAVPQGGRLSGVDYQTLSAAACLHHNLTLLTRNVKDFADIEGLTPVQSMVGRRRAISKISPIEDNGEETT
jgi:hypothetical protein